MSIVKVVYDHRVDGQELVIHEKILRQYREVDALIDSYPWKSELRLSEKLGVGGGFHFIHGDEKIYACYQFVPVELDKGFLFLDIVLAPGWLNILGRKALSKDFDTVSTSEAKMKIKELFDYSIASLYDKYHRLK
ncbi:hypothetical protein [Vibrio europaeus]|uniref:hypothetical protein n=1 Tax=Vibrio europaeus TaxID=300876 RepID=UPI0039E024DB